MGTVLSAFLGFLVREQLSAITIAEGYFFIEDGKATDDSVCMNI
jgi:hypothetical protein